MISILTEIISEIIVVILRFGYIDLETILPVLVYLIILIKVYVNSIKYIF